MNTQPVKRLYKKFLDAWNEQDPEKYASYFTENGCVMGFDGSQMNSKDEIEKEIGKIFSNHQTANYVSKIRKIKFLSTEIALLRGVAGMIPPGGTDINPDANAIQSLVASRNGNSNSWRIILFQNTPAQFHGRPELADSLTQELQKIFSDE